MDVKALSLVVVFVGLFLWVSADKECIAIRPAYALYGHNDQIYSSSSLEDCAEKCRDETSFVCKSFDYVASGKCYLATEDHIDDPTMFGKHSDSTYGFLIDCNGCNSSDNAGNDSDDEDDGDESAGSGYDRRMNILRQLFRRRHVGK